jgi:hypothetical protein
MHIAQEGQYPTIKPLPQALEAKLRDCLEQAPSGIPLGGPLAQTGANVECSLGHRFVVDENLEFVRLLNPDFVHLNPNGVDHLSSSLTTAALGRSIRVLGDSLRVVEELDRFGKVGQVVGVLQPLCRVVSALLEPGPESKIEITRAIFEGLPEVVELIADSPGMERAKPYTEGVCLVLKLGEVFLAVPVQYPEHRQRAAAESSGQQQGLESRVDTVNQEAGS